MLLSRTAFAAGFALFFACSAHAQEDCKSRGELDTGSCDENKDLVADAPKDATRPKKPPTPVSPSTPSQDPPLPQPLR